MDKFVLTFDGNYDKLFTDVMDDEEAHGDRLQTILETTCASELKKIYPPTGKRKLLVKRRNCWLKERNDEE